MAEVPDILTLANKERFRRRLLIGTRVIATLLILSILWIGFVQVKYVKEVNQIKSEYGSVGYCYLCGLEAGRSCTCNFVPELIHEKDDFSWKDYLQDIANQNVVECENRNSDEYRTPDLSNITLK